MSLIYVDMKKCKKDGICVDVCPAGILALDAETGPRVRSRMAPFCIACGHCVAVCPHGALDNVRAPLAKQVPLASAPVIDSKTASTFLRSRRSIRCYKDEPIPRELTLELLNAARYAPSGHNSQSISYMVVSGRKSVDDVSGLVADWMRGLVEAKSELAARFHMAGIVRACERGNDRILRRAPQIVVASAPRELGAAQVSTYLALEYVELYATTVGLGTCWAGFAQACAQQYEPLQKFLRVPEEKIVTGILMMGYPRHTFFRLPERNPLDVTWFGDE
jgi:nitroreductase/NAD-dependent dihydropyrimidine dehydrogenase PreA subunit